MAKKRKSDAARLEEVDRTMFSTFCSAANSLSQLYTQAMNQQKLSFQAGERHALEKFYQWILRQQEEGSRVTTVDVVSYLQNELDHGIEDPSMSPRAPSQLQPTPPVVQVQPNPFSSTPSVQGLRPILSDQQTKNVFSNALSSPVRRSLQHCHFQGNYHNPSNPLSRNGVRHQESSNNRETDSPSHSDSLMDMNSDSPSHDSTY